MEELFGIPMEAVAIVLTAMLALTLGVVAVLAVRNRVLLRMGLRNIRRRPGRSVLIVVGLMLGTTIIASALATGDTMSRTIRSSTVKALGQTDELVSARSADVQLAVQSGAATGVRYFPESEAARIRRALADDELVDGVAPAIIEPVAVQDTTTRQNEPRVTLFASDPRQLKGFGTIRDSDGREVSLAALAPGRAFINREAAEELGARPGDAVRVFAAGRATTMRVQGIVDYDGTGTDKSALLLPLRRAQALLGREGLIRHVMVSNRGGATEGAEHTGAVVARLAPVLAGTGLEVDKTKQDALDIADASGSAFMSFFTTFGSFSIAAGILLIFLIFVMLAAERRSELGIARAIGTRRSHLVQLFLFEGVAYDLLAAAVGALLGVAVAYGMVIVLQGAFSQTGDVDITYSVTPRSVLVAYAIGVLLTFAVVTVSARRVSRMNIVTAIRNLPEPPSTRVARRHEIRAAVGLAFGALLIAAGISGTNGTALGLGVSMVILSAVPLARAAGVPDRTARTVAGLALIAWFVLPMSRWLFGDLTVDFSIFILSGLMVVIGATWTIMYNADLLLGALARTLGRFRGLAPVLKMSMAYPLRSLFRTGVTLAMFTLVVFTLVVGATTTGSFVNGFNDKEAFSGGFDVRADVAPASPIPDMRRAIARAPGLRATDFRVVSGQSFLPVRARQQGAGRSAHDYAVRGLDRAFLDHNTFGMAALGKGYDSAEAVWRAVRDDPGLAVIDAAAVPRRANFNFGAIQSFRLSGLYLEDKTFDPITVTIADPQSAKRRQVKIIGVLSETAPLALAGILTSQETLAATFEDRAAPTSYLYALAPGVDPKGTAKRLESAFVANGMQADALDELLADAVSASITFDRVIEGFMGLGLIVGVAALGVITARSVVERRQQIGVLRSIGFRRRMVQLSFLLESSFIALTSIVVGTALGLAVAYNVIHDAQRQPSWGNLSFDVPWANLAVIFLVVYAVALATTYLPALRASRVYPAEALRYQ